MVNILVLQCNYNKTNLHVKFKNLDVKNSKKMRLKYKTFEVGYICERKPLGIRSKLNTSNHLKIIPRQFRSYLLSGTYTINVKIRMKYINL